ncbi:MAG: phosphatidylglycerol lysyltransferase domain-containing protein [Eubacteriales bacterium]|nr:phosphatidylglycerol lysyltransferase domain-containing protein [Eubacteriales bacterium]
MDFKNNITLDDKEIFDRYFKSAQPDISEFTFTNFFMWRQFYRYRYAIIYGCLCIIAVPLKGMPYAMAPICSRENGMTTEPREAWDPGKEARRSEHGENDGFEKAALAISEYFAANGWKLIFRKAGIESAGKLAAVFDLDPEIRNGSGPETENHKQGEAADSEGGFRDGATAGMPASFGRGIYQDRDNSDYLYITENLIHLKGGKYDSKRNHINKFKKLYGEFEYEEIDSSLISDCKEVNEEWCRKIGCEEHKPLYCEKIANFELLDNYEALGVSGAVIKVGGRPQAFTVGEMLNDETAVIHIEKANTDIHGLYTIINKEFCIRSWSDTRYINREQDLGIEGIRKAKLSYHPHRMVDKYSLFV